MNFRNIVVALLGIALTACATFNAPNDIQLDGSSETGLAVLSITTNVKPAGIQVFYEGIDNKRSGEITIKTIQDPLDWEESVFGRVVVLNLPEGKYHINHFAKMLDYELTEEMSVPFEVSNGKVTYFGNLDLHTNPRAGELFYRIKDERVRDLDVFVTRYVNFSRDDVDVKLVELD